MSLVLVGAAILIAALLAMFGGRFSLKWPVAAAVICSVLGIALFFAGMARGLAGGMPMVSSIGVACLLLGAVGLLSLGLLWAYRRWSGYARKDIL